MTIDPYDNPHDKQNPLRQIATLAMMKSTELSGPVLDIGESPFSRLLEQELEMPVTGTTHELDRGRIEGEWGTICCFEVLEHVGNPLRLLDQMKAALKAGGSIWLSTPLVARWRPDSFRGNNHVFEFTRPQLDFLLQKAKLQVKQRREIRYKYWWQYLTGPRPFVRYFSDRCVILQLQECAPCGKSAFFQPT
jgi:SAM-dependent methyltransferase